MKNRRVLYIFLILLLIVLIVLFSSVLFSVKTADISCSGDLVSLNIEKVNEIDTYFKKTTGKNIFFIDENSIINELEKNYPYINVSNIERVFPSKIILHFTERKELFAIKLPSDSYAVIDNYGKVVAVKEQNLSNAAIGDITDNVILNTSGEFSAELSDKLTEGSVILALKFYSYYNMLDGYDITDFRGFANEVTITADSINIKTRFGAVIDIVNSDEELLEKVQLAAGILDNLSDTERSSSEITILTGDEYNIR